MATDRYMKTTNSNDDKFDGISDSDPNEKVYKIYTQSITIQTHIIELSDTIEESYKYADLRYFLRDLPAGTMNIQIHLSGRGGYVDGLMPLVNAIKECQVPVDMVTIGRCYSAHAMLALCGRSLTMKRDSVLMFHSGSDVVGGKLHEMATSFKHNTKFDRETSRRILLPFLTEDELAKIMRDQDIHIHWNSVGLKKRMKRHFGTGDKK